MNKNNLTEAETRSQTIRPALVAAWWQGADVHIREEYFTDGRMHIEGRKPLRGKRSYVDYLLVYKNVRLAVVEAKDNKHSIGAGMQQGLRYAELLDVPFVYSSNGDGFLAHDRTLTAALAQATQIKE